MGGSRMISRELGCIGSVGAWLGCQFCDGLNVVLLLGVTLVTASRVWFL